MGDASKKGTVKLPAVSLSRASSVKIVEKQGKPTPRPHALRGTSAALIPPSKHVYATGAPTGKESKNSIKEGWLTKQGARERNRLIASIAPRGDLTAPRVHAAAVPLRKLHPQLAAALVPAEGGHFVLLQRAVAGTLAPSLSQKGQQHTQTYA